MGSLGNVRIYIRILFVEYADSYIMFDDNSGLDMIYVLGHCMNVPSYTSFLCLRMSGVGHVRVRCAIALIVPRNEWFCFEPFGVMSISLPFNADRLSFPCEYILARPARLVSYRVFLLGLGSWAGVPSGYSLDAFPLPCPTLYLSR